MFDTAGALPPDCECRTCLVRWRPTRPSRTRQPAPGVPSHAADGVGDLPVLVGLPSSLDQPAAPPFTSVVIIGAGLIGASIGLALRRRSVDVAVIDADPHVESRAVELGAGRHVEGQEKFELAVVCVPPSSTASVLRDAQRRGLADSFSDVAGVKTKVLADAETLGCEMATIVGGHPFAGRERGGPDNADRELFTDRPWVLCPTLRTSGEALLAARRLAEGCGAVAIVMSPEAHDAAAARLSHVPQLLASALAAVAAPLDERSISLAGQGFRDLTRIAESPPGLWREVIAENAMEVAAALRDLIEELAPLQAALVEVAVGSPGVAESAPLHSARDRKVRNAVQDLVLAGNDGRRRLPLKPGRPATSASSVVVAVSDRAGELARLLFDAAAVDVNIEDVHVQHGAAAARGLVDLDIAIEDVGRLLEALAARGWRCWSPSSLT